jgi:hypothetical protein
MPPDAGGAVCARFAAAHLNNHPPPAGRMPLLRAIDSAPNNINLAPESS